VIDDELSIKGSDQDKLKSHQIILKLQSFATFLSCSKCILDWDPGLEVNLSTIAFANWIKSGFLAVFWETPAPQKNTTPPSLWAFSSLFIIIQASKMKRKYTALIGYCSPSDYEKKFYQDNIP
jgi:hypothetical protein